MNAINFISFARIKYAKLRPPWDNKFVGFLYLFNKTLQQVVEDGNNNKDRQQPKKSVEKCEKKIFKPFKPLVFLWKLFLWSTECLFQANGNRIIFG